MDINTDWLRKINLYWIAALGVPWLLYAGWQSARTTRWPSTIGRITQYQRKLTGSGSSGIIRRRRRWRNYRTDVAYNFRVDGQRYVGNAIWPLLDGEDAQLNFGGTFQRGDSVLIWYNPANPFEAVLVRTPAPDNLFVVAWIVGFCVAEVLKRKRLGEEQDRRMADAKERAERARAAKEAGDPAG